jgi:hypothetical protein
MHYEVVVFFIMPQDFSLERLLAGRRWRDTIKASVRSGGRFLSSS